MDDWEERVTVSSCGEIAKWLTTTKIASLVKTLLYTSFWGNNATQWSHLQEPVMKGTYLNKKRQVSPDTTVQESGFVIHSLYHWLEASHNDTHTLSSQSCSSFILTSKLSTVIMAPCGQQLSPTVLNMPGWLHVRFAWFWVDGRL